MICIRHLKDLTSHFLKDSSGEKKDWQNEWHSLILSAAKVDRSGQVLTTGATDTKVSAAVRPRGGRCASLWADCRLQVGGRSGASRRPNPDVCQAADRWRQSEMLHWSAAKLALVMMTPPDDEKPSPRRAVQLESGQRGSKITHTHTHIHTPSRSNYQTHTPGRVRHGNSTAARNWTSTFALHLFYLN